LIFVFKGSSQATGPQGKRQSTRGTATMEASRRQTQNSRRPVSSPTDSTPTLNPSLMKKISRLIDKLTIKTPNSPAQTRPRDQAQVSLTHSNTTIPPPPFPSHHGSSTYSPSEGPVIKHVRHRSGEKLTNLRRGTSLPNIPQRLLTDLDVL